MNNVYPIGVAGQPWQAKEKEQWLNLQSPQRSYITEVENKIKALASKMTLAQYGTLSYREHEYSLWALSHFNTEITLPTILITGGVHGYETSGVLGALRFIETEFETYHDKVNIVVLPCISPWGYETINRWNPATIDPNRSFYYPSPAEESALAMAYITSLNIDFAMHIDLHETTDTDNSEFRPALAARDAIEQTHWDIPDGFYLVAESDKPAADFQKAIIDSVAKVTHIAPPDAHNQIIGVPITQKGVIEYAGRDLGLCMGMTNAKFVSTTEVYPDSHKVDAENCILAQVAAIKGGLAFVHSNT